jgi:hypothetical protein
MRITWAALLLSRRFYEKVVKVKADVAAILNFFLPLRSRRSRRTIATRPRWSPLGGCARGVSAECFETPLAGGAAASMCASAFCWRAACQRRGGNPPAPAFPRRGKRERGSSTFTAAGSSSLRGADGRHAADLVCARSSATFLSIPITNINSILSISVTEVLAPPTPCRASIRTLNGPQWARCKLGSDLKPRSITKMTHLGCWALPSRRRSLKDRSV